MRYMGGKHRQSKAILDVLSKAHPKGTVYVEPFCGAMGSAEKLVPYFGGGFLSDASKPLINMWLALLQGWEPPDTMDEETYKKYADKRHNPDVDDPLTAWAGYALSFGGKWYGGLARQGNGDSAGTARSQLNQKTAALRKAKAIQGSSVTCMDYAEAVANAPNGAVVYLDPPYADRTKAHHTAKGFNSQQFWNMAKELSSRCNVYVSEFTAPRGWVVVHSWGDTVVRHRAGTQTDGTCECLFRFEGA